ncbi:MAG: helix-turn-helix domain-containing protein [Deltaproteobacteria bacterium]|jgi:excisionase family DNA binding protein|nr:helix-turn-helix domain-containing protein [Deltaproteobacteria bacterium]MCL5880079.1 helix-turn-helix domain-containing protein [Deltaproteobacteria bacterium]
MKKIENMKPGYIDLKQLSDYTSISRPQVYNLIKQKKIPHIKLGAKYVFKISDIDEYMDKNRQV